MNEFKLKCLLLVLHLTHLIFCTADRALSLYRRHSQVAAKIIVRQILAKPQAKLPFSVGNLVKRLCGLYNQYKDPFYHVVPHFHEIERQQECNIDALATHITDIDKSLHVNSLTNILVRFHNAHVA